MKSNVVIKECRDYQLPDIIDKLNEGMKLIGGWDKFVKPGMKVLLKINLIGPKGSDTAAVTHSEFVRAVVKILKAKGCTVWIGDSSGGVIAGIAPTLKSLKVSGLEDMAKEEGVEIKNFDREGVVEVKASGRFESKMFLAKPLFDADLVINLPKLKTHTAGIYTGAVKNVFGCVPGLRKAEYHRLAPNPADFGHVIADIHKALNLKLHIMDGITAMAGEGPTAGEVYHSGKILISTDPLALDTAAAKMIGLDIEEVPILAAARERRLGESDLKNIEITGDYDSLPELKNFKLPKSFGQKKKRNYNALVKVIGFLKSRPRINMKLCKKCNLCVESCPVHAIDRESKKIDYSKCIECLCCHELCMQKAVELRKDNPLADMMTKLYRGSYK